MAYVYDVLYGPRDVLSYFAYSDVLGSHSFTQDITLEEVLAIVNNT